MKVTINEIIEAVRLEFRRYGFRADGAARPTFKSGETGFRCAFDEEAATGQAAFSQYKVTPHFKVWIDAADVVDEAFDVKDEKIGIDISVSYQHSEGGSNGYSVRYQLEIRFMEKPELRRMSRH